MALLVVKDFKFVINNVVYDVQCPTKEKLNHEPMTEMKNVKFLVHRLSAILYLKEIS
jgi:hypothetical protein